MTCMPKQGKTSLFCSSFIFYYLLRYFRYFIILDSDIIATKPCFDVIIHEVLSFCQGEKLLCENKKLDIQDHYEKDYKHAL